MTGTYIGTVESVDDMDGGRTAGVYLRVAGGRGVYLRLPRRNIGMAAELRAARRSDARIMVECEPLELRLGAPIADIVRLAVAA
jgi:hypothetical protein